jgi:hypothetical protein
MRAQRGWWPLGAVQAMPTRKHGGGGLVAVCAVASARVGHASGHAACCGSAFKSSRGVGPELELGVQQHAACVAPANMSWLAPRHVYWCV